MSYNDNRIEIKGLTAENAETLKSSHEGYDNPVHSGQVEIVKESDNRYTAIYDRDEVKDFKCLGEDASLMGGQVDSLYK